MVAMLIEKLVAFVGAVLKGIGLGVVFVGASLFVGLAWCFGGKSARQIIRDRWRDVEVDVDWIANQRAEDNENYMNDLRAEFEQEAHEFAHEQRTERDQVEEAIAGERMVYYTIESKRDILCSCFDCPMSGPIAVGKA